MPHANSQFPIPYPYSHNRQSLCVAAKLWKNLWTNHPQFVENITLLLEKVFDEQGLSDRLY